MLGQPGEEGGCCVQGRLPTAAAGTAAWIWQAVGCSFSQQPFSRLCALQDAVADLHRSNPLNRSPHRRDVVLPDGVHNLRGYVNPPTAEVVAALSPGGKHHGIATGGRGVQLPLGDVYYTGQVSVAQVQQAAQFCYWL